VVAKQHLFEGFGAGVVYLLMQSVEIM